MARHLDLIEPGLTLIDKEKRLSNDKGAKGFVDLFAQSKSGQLVVVEIKRSNATAREALHELSKYAALVKENLLVKNSEFRLFVLSTEWHELLVPFAEFVQATRYDCVGYEIKLKKDGLPGSIKPVTLPDLAAPRRISGRHFIWEFADEKSARGAIPVIAAHMQSVGLKDFVLLLIKLQIPEENNRYGWFVYFAQQRLTLDAYMQLIKKRFKGHALKEFRAWLDDCTELEDKTEEAADKVWEDSDHEVGLHSKLHPVSVQISHPNKARYWFKSGRIKSVETTRYGRFDDSRLKDEKIVDELVGSSGESDIHTDIKADIKSKPEMDALFSASDNALFFNPVWRSAIRDLCSYAERNGAVSLHLRVFSNDDILRTVAGLAIGYPNYTPTFTIEIRSSSGSETFAGFIEWNGTKPDFTTVLKKHFEGDPFDYEMLRHFGANRGVNAEIMDDLGLEYVVGQIKPNDYATVRIQGATIKEFSRPKFERIGVFLAENSEFVGSLIDMLASQEQEFQEVFDKQMFRMAEAEMESRCDGKRYDTVWLGDLTNCDLCKRPFDEARFMIDGGITKTGPWGCLCATCFLSGHGELGWGKGQLYKKERDDWRLVAGGRPRDDGDEA